VDKELSAAATSWIRSEDGPHAPFRSKPSDERRCLASSQGQELYLSNLCCKSSALSRFAESRAGAGRRQGFPHFSQVRSASWIADRYINGVSLHVNLGAVHTTHEHKQVRRSVSAVGDKRTSLVVGKGELS
jgi:hypothetical protein